MKELSIILWIVIIFYFDYNFDYSDMIPIYEKPLTIVPYDVKCLFNEPMCDRGDITYGDIFIFLSFFLLGRVYPGYIKYVFTISLLYEICLIANDKPAKILIGPMISLTAYMAGELSVTK
jgi:hypothetical protein